MRVVVDTNILFSYFWEESFTKKIIANPFLELISPEKSIDELEKYSKEIIKKTKINRQKFNVLLTEVKRIVNFLPQSFYKKYLAHAKKISPDIGDVDFFALCLQEKTLFWSNDSILKFQEDVSVLSTKEMMDLIF